MKLVKEHIKSYWILFILVVIFLSLEAMCDILQPTMLSYIVDKGVKTRSMATIMHYGIWMFVIVIFGAFNAVMRNFISSHVSFKIGAKMRHETFRKILGFSFENMDCFEGGTLMTRLTNDITMVQQFINGMMRIFLKAPIIGIGSVIMVARLNIKLLWVYAILLPVVFLIIYLNMIIGYPLFSKVQKSLDKLNHMTKEFLNGIRVVKAFNRFNYEQKRFKSANERLAGDTEHSMKLMAIFPPLLSFFINMSIVFVLYKSAYWIQIGGMGIGETMAFINYILQFLFACMVIARVFTMFVRSKASAERISEVLETENSTKIAKEPIQNEIKGHIKFKNVTFGFGSGEEVLKDVNFKVKAGETLGIIGSTGAGKSSLINLIPRFYDIKTGKILIDDIDVRDYCIKNLRSQIGVVPQKNILFTGTVRENLLWGNQSATEEELNEVAKASMIYEFICNSETGYDTLLGRGGVNLSGGQKQRMAIARALLKDPSILILDDATSAVDVFTEKNIKEALKNKASKVTVVLIAQRITSIMDADQIIVLDHGEIVGCGTHKELIKNCMIYQEIYSSQLG